jgi:AcrR family transcriptional regulator
MGRSAAKPMDRREQDRLKTRAAILNAAEALMREQGHGAVTSRRVAERAALKSQLVHYHFGTMDELFLELFRRSEKRFFKEQLAAINSPDPVRQLWKAITARDRMDFVAEFQSAANHRQPLKDELARAIVRFRMMYNAMLGNLFTSRALDQVEITPEAFSFLLAAVASALIGDANIGVSEGHEEILAFVEALIDKVQPRETVPAGSVSQG